VVLEHPQLIQALGRGGGFGGKPAPLAATSMFGRLPEAIAEVKRLTEVVEVAPRTWLIRCPIVNAVLFETNEGLVLVDTGMAPAGPAIVEAIRKVSQKPVRVVIYTHGHVDHAFGTWALLQAGEKPEIIAHENLPKRFERYTRLRGSLAHYMSQPLALMPKDRSDMVWPTRVFHDELRLTVGGEEFILKHHNGETDDHLYVWVPGRKVLASADFYQGFLPNAGNGKRVQRYVEDWIVALREMAALKPAILLPAHNAAVTKPAEIQEDLTVLAEALQSIVDQTITGLNAGLRKDQIFASVRLPDRLANQPTLSVRYVSPQDISKMILKQYTGWWDDIPSEWTPAPLAEQARAIVTLAGGMGRLVAYARKVAKTDVALACHLADWAFYANPNDPAAQALVIDVYLQRALDPRSNTQEILAYIDIMGAARQAQMAHQP